MGDGVLSPAVRSGQCRLRISEFHDEIAKLQKQIYSLECRIIEEERLIGNIQRMENDNDK